MCLFKVDNGNTTAMNEICSKLAIKILERRQRCSGIFIANFEHISHIVLVFPFSSLNKQMSASLLPSRHLHVQS